MTIYDVVFTKKDGKDRRMSFIKLEDMKKEFLNESVTGDKPKKLARGFELVWDLNAEGFRTVNWNTIKEYAEREPDHSLALNMADKGWI